MIKINIVSGSRILTKLFTDLETTDFETTGPETTDPETTDLKAMSAQQKTTV